MPSSTSPAPRLARLPWTGAYRKQILSSRMEATHTLTDAMRMASSPPPVFLNASAVGIYGDRPGERLTESPRAGTASWPTSSRRGRRRRTSRRRRPASSPSAAASCSVPAARSAGSCRSPARTRRPARQRRPALAVGRPLRRGRRHPAPAHLAAERPREHRRAHSGDGRTTSPRASRPRCTGRTASPCRSDWCSLALQDAGEQLLLAEPEGRAGEAAGRRLQFPARDRGVRDPAMLDR